MTLLSNMTLTKTHRVLIYGGPKSGKTELAGRLAEKFKLKWFDLEKGYDTLFKFPQAWKERIEIISLPDTRDYPIAAETLLKVIKGGEHRICVEHGKVSCALCTKNGAEFSVVNLSLLSGDEIVVFDSMTQLVNSAIAHITKAQPFDYKLTYDDWARLGVLMDIFLSNIQQASYNVIVISHEIGADLEDGKEKIVPVAGTRNFSRNSAKYFDEVIYCDVKNSKHTFGSATTYMNNIRTGSRTGMSLEKMSIPSLLPLFLNTLEGEGPETPGNISLANLSKLHKGEPVKIT